MLKFRKPMVFIWDKANKDKNWLKHKVSNQECEEVFYDKKKKISKDIFHSKGEERFIILGQTQNKRLLYVVFTIRNKKIRVISARDINKKEVPLYEKTT